jgi:cytidine deaminase
MTKKIPWDQIAALAESMRDRAYAPYSNYRVGAVLVARKDSKAQHEVFVGANVENASYPVCACAERTAVNAAVIAGVREFVALVVATEGPRAAAPCGMCRQILAEFATDLPIGLVVDGKIVEFTSLAVLLPKMFGGADLAEAEAKSRAKPKARAKSSVLTKVQSARKSTASK